MQESLSFTKLEITRHSEIGPQQSNRTERAIDLSGGSVQVRQYSFSGNQSCIWSCDQHFLSFPLTSRSTSTWAKYLDTGGQANVPVQQMMFVPAGATIQTGGAAGNLRSVVCLFSPALFDSIVGEGARWDNELLLESLHFRSLEIEGLILKIYQEMKEERAYGTLMIDALFRGLAIALIRRLALSETTALPRSGGLAPWRMRRIRDRVNADLPPPHVEELAELTSLSVRQLTRAFKEETGQTVAQFVREAIIQRAWSMLADTDTPAHEIASRLGFADSRSFAWAFRRATGLRPSDIDGRAAGRLGRAPMTKDHH
ncbi:MAG TPA: helix-turn-helix transcriptional regulator [Novosphingobium sp.]|nr:helix-turn-helix transcriptional regulator [Novosphingobium sp.]